MAWLPESWKSEVPAEGPLLAAVSGGADSVFMLEHLMGLGFGPRLVVAHVNHGTRGGESEADELFVQKLAERLGLHFRCERPVGLAGADEAALRRARHDALVWLAEREGARAIFFAHNRSDLAEWFLIAAMRGAGVDGLAGVQAVSRRGSFTLIRPMLGLHGAEIRDQLTARGITWREDLSNADARHLRNRVRHEVLPLLESLWEGAVDGIGTSAEFCADAGRFLAERIVPVADRCALRDGSNLLVDRDLITADWGAHTLAPLLRELIRRVTPTGPQGETYPPRRTLVEQAVSHLLRNPSGGGEASFSAAGMHLVLGPRWWAIGTDAPAHAFFRWARSFPYLIDRHDVATAFTLPDEAGQFTATEGLSCFLAPGMADGGDWRLARLNSAWLRDHSHPLIIRRIGLHDRIEVRGVRKEAGEWLKTIRVPVALRGRLLGLYHGEELIWIPGVIHGAALAEATQPGTILLGLRWAHHVASAGAADQR